MCGNAALRHAAASVTALGREGEWPKARGRDGRLSAVARLRAKEESGGLSLKGRPQRGTPEGTEGGVMRRCREGRGATAPQARPRRGAATCELASERITTPSVQGGAGLELHEVRWRTGTDRPPASRTRDRSLSGAKRKKETWREACPRRGLGRVGRTDVSVANTAREAERME